MLRSLCLQQASLHVILGRWSKDLAGKANAGAPPGYGRGLGAWMNKRAAGRTSVRDQRSGKGRDGGRKEGRRKTGKEKRKER